MTPLVGDPLVGLLRLLIRAYQLTISPILPAHCRYAPSCSSYAMEALAMHGAVKGSWLALRRLLSCHPWGGFGYDPVPLFASDRSRSRRRI